MPRRERYSAQYEFALLAYLVGQLRRRRDNCTASRAHTRPLAKRRVSRIIPRLARYRRTVRDAKHVIDVRWPRALGATPAECSGDVRLSACTRYPRDNSGSHLPWRRRAISGAARHGEPGLLEDASANGLWAHAGVLHDHAEGASPSYRIESGVAPNRRRRRIGAGGRLIW